MYSGMAHERKKNLYSGLIVALVSFLAYANSLGNGFVWDDSNVVVNNPALQGSPLELFRGIDTTHDYELLPYYRPLAILTFLVEGRIYGLIPFPMHLFNVLMHAANAALVYLLAQSLVSDHKAAIVAGLLFAVHPVNTEAVDFISGGRNTILACFFVLSAFILYRRSVMSEHCTAAFAASVLMMAGFFSKETALAVLPLILTLESSLFRENTSGSMPRSITRLLPVAAAVLCYLVMRWMALSPLGIQKGIIPGIGSEQLQSIYKIPDLLNRVMDNLYIIPRYFLTIVWPVSLSPRYIVPAGLQSVAFPVAAGWLLICSSAGWLITRRRSRATLFGMLWLAAFYLPVSGIFMFSSAPMADRYLYLPMIGLWIISGEQAALMLSSFRHRNKQVVPALVGVLCVLACITIWRNTVWKDDVSLFSRLVEQNPENAFGYAGLGEAYYNMSRQDGRYLALARGELEKALSLDQRIPGVHAKMGNISLTQGDNENALRYYSLALGVYPLDKEALLNRGITLENLGRGKEALEDFRRFMSIPGYEFADARPYAEARIRTITSELKAESSPAR